MQFIRDFPRKFECAANQVVARGYSIAFSVDVGVDRDYLVSHGIVRIRPYTPDVSIEIMMLEGKSVPRVSSIHPADHLTPMFGDGNKGTLHLYPLSAGMNPYQTETDQYTEEQRFCFTLGRHYCHKYYAKCFDEARLSTMKVDTDLLRKFGYNI
jgi:hypothetical protein